MSTHDQSVPVDAPVADQPKTTVQTQVEVPTEILKLAERRADAAGGDLDEYLFDHLLIEYEFVEESG